MFVLSWHLSLLSEHLCLSSFFFFDKGLMLIIFNIYFWECVPFFSFWTLLLQATIKILSYNLHGTMFWKKPTRNCYEHLDEIKNLCKDIIINVVISFSITSHNFVILPLFSSTVLVISYVCIKIQETVSSHFYIMNGY